MFEFCDKFFADVVKLIGVKIVVGVGKFVEERVRKVLIDSEVEIFFIMYFSLVSLVVNVGWSDIVLI